MERELVASSYWTIRNRLNEIVEEMDQQAPTPPLPPDADKSARRKDILERLNQGHITVSEAAELLNQA
jgi:hypothetical protein